MKTILIEKHGEFSGHTYDKLVEMLYVNNYKVVIAESLSQIPDMLKEHKPNVVVTGYTPDIHHVDKTIKFIREYDKTQHHKTDVVILTDHPNKINHMNPIAVYPKHMDPLHVMQFMSTIDKCR